MRIEPGEPPSIDYWDCELLRPTPRSAVLRPASLTIGAAHLACEHPTTRHSNFGLSIEALMPEVGGPAKASSMHPSEPTAGAQHG